MFNSKNNSTIRRDKKLKFLCFLTSASLLLGGTLNAQTWLGFPEYVVEVGADPRSMISEDFNGDGFIDFVTANRGDDSVSVVLGSGNGLSQLDSNQNHVSSYSVGEKPIVLKANDFNQDGALDIVTANYGSDNISVLIGNTDNSGQSD